MLAASRTENAGKQAEIVGAFMRLTGLNGDGLYMKFWADIVLYMLSQRFRLICEFFVLGIDCCSI